MKLLLLSKCCFLWLQVLWVSGCTSIPKTYDEAKQISVSQQPILEHWVEREEMSFNVFDIKFAGCLENVPREQLSSHQIILGINQGGEVLQVHLENNTKVGNCLARAMKTQKFPEPPVTPAYLILNLDFTVPEERTDDEPVVKDVIN